MGWVVVVGTVGRRNTVSMPSVVMEGTARRGEAVDWKESRRALCAVPVLSLVVRVPEE